VRRGRGEGRREGGSRTKKKAKFLPYSDQKTRIAKCCSSSTFRTYKKFGNLLDLIYPRITLSKSCSSPWVSRDPRDRKENQGGKRIREKEGEGRRRRREGGKKGRMEGGK
jgi:hypothetical protein